MNKVLQRPMFARMRDGRIVPVQRHWVGALIAGGRIAAPFAMRYGVRPGMNILKKGIGGLRNYFRPGGGYGKGINAETAKKFPGLANKVKNAQRFNITSTHPANIALQTGVVTAPFLPYEKMFGESEEDFETTPGSGGAGEGKFKSGIEQEGGAKGKYEHTKKEDKKDLENMPNAIKKGNLDDFIMENKEVFNKHLGDTKARTKTGFFNMLTQMGLNMASKKGEGFMEIVAESAKEPLQGFANLGQELYDRADKINMAAIEQGLSQQEKEKERVHEKELLQMETEAGGDDTALMKNFNFFKGIFTTKGGEQLKSDEELIMMSKSAAGNTRKDFITENYSKFVGVEDPATGSQYTQQKIMEMLGGAWDFAETGAMPSAGTYSEDDITTAMKENNLGRDEVIKIFEEQYNLTPGQ